MKTHDDIDQALATLGIAAWEHAKSRGALRLMLKTVDLLRTLFLPATDDHLPLNPEQGEK